MADDEVAALDRVLLRLGGTDDDKLEAVLDKLLPRLLGRLGGDEKVRAKTLQVLQHVNKRVKDNTEILLPCFAFARLAQPAAQSNGFTVNFALVYLELGAGRLSPGQKSRLVPQLLCGLAALQEMQRAIVFRVLAALLPHVSISGEMADWFVPGTTEADKATLLSYLMDWLFFVPASAGAPNATPPGLTPARVARLKDKGGALPAGPQLAAVQLAALRLLLSGAFPAERVLPHVIVARNAPRHDVVDAASQGMARLLKTVDLDDAQLVLELAALAASSVRAGGADGARKEAPLAVRERALGVLVQAGETGLSDSADALVALMEHCLVGSQSGSNLRVQALELGQRLLHKGSDAALAAADAPTKLALVLRKQLEQVRQFQGSGASMREREQSYSCLAALAHRCPEKFAGGVVLVADLLGVLERETDVRLAIQEALGALCAAFCAPRSSDAARLTIKASLLPYAASSEPKARLVAADWCRRLFAFDDPEARFVCVSLSCDADLATRQVAIRGLLPDLCAAGADGAPVRRAKKALETLGDAAKLESGRLALAWTDANMPEEHAILLDKRAAEAFPQLAAWLDCLRAEGRLDGLLDAARHEDAAKQSQLAAVLGFAGACLRQNTRAGRGPDSSTLEAHRGIVEACLAVKDRTAVRVLHRVASKCLVELVDAREAVFEVRPEWLLDWLKADSAVVRENVAQLVPRCEAAADGPFAETLIANMRKKVASAVPARHGAVLACGSLLGGPLAERLQADVREALARALLDVLEERSKFRVVTLACIKAVGAAAANGALALGAEGLAAILDRLEAVAAFDGSASGDSAVDASNAAAVAGALETLGRICCAPGLSETVKARATNALFAAGEQKHPEAQLIVARGLSALCKGAAEGVPGPAFAPTLARVVRLAKTSSRNRTRSASAFWLLQLVRDLGASEAAQAHLEEVHGTFAGLLRERGELVRECAARGMAWTYVSAQSPALREELVNSLARHLAAKTLFLSKLKAEQERERKRKAEEDAAKESGTGVVPARAADSDSEDEDEDGDRTMTDAPNAGDPGDPASAAAGAASSSSAGGSTRAPAPLNTVYKEIFQVANRVGQPKLTYRLLYLSCGDGFWATTTARDLRLELFEEDRDDEAAGDATPQHDMPDLGEEATQQLVPVLFRFRYDLEASVKLTMTKLWDTVTADMGSEQEVLAAHQEAILAEVLRNVAAKHFRERHGGAMALTWIIRETEDAALVEHLEAMWPLALRLVDDLNEATKLAAALLARALVSLTVRLCNAEEKKTEAGKAIARRALDKVLPFLLEKGLMDQSKEGQAIVAHTLARVVKVCKENIRPSITEVTVRLLENMSGMEDQKLQYAMFHTSDQGGDLGISRGELETLRVQASNESPMQQAVDVCVEQIAQGDALTKLAPELARLARAGVGLPTLAATSRTIARLAARRDLEPGLRTHARALLKGLARGLVDRSPMIRRSFAATAAAVARVAEASAVRDYVAVLERLYEDPGDEKARLTVGNALRELLQRTPDIFGVLEEQLAPLVLLARYDDDEDIAEVFADIWTENAGTVRNGVAGRLHFIAPYCVAELSNTRWLRKRQAAEALREVARAVPAEALAPHLELVLDSLADALPGRLWAGKEALLDALGELWARAAELDVASRPPRFRAADALCREVLLPESARRAPAQAYTRAALTAMAKACRASSPERPDELIRTLLEQAERARTPAEEGDEPVESETVAATFVALGALWTPAASSALVGDLVTAAKSALRGSDYVVAVGVMRGVGRVLDRAALDAAALPHLLALADLGWSTLVENRNPTALVAALEALRALHARSDLDAAQRALLQPAADSARRRVQPLLEHRDPSVVLAASRLIDSLGATST